PPFNTELKRETQTYTPLDAAGQQWKICVSIPHLKDAYWLAVNFALVDEARRLGVSLRINEAGGYENLDVQRTQIQDCMKTGADGLIVSGITTDGVNDLVEGYLAEGIPVIDLINWISAEGLTARAAVTYWDNGYQTGAFLKRETAGKETKILWFPGPKGPGWSKLGNDGLVDALKDSNIAIVDTGWGDTGRATQAKLIEDSLAKHPDVDYIVGTTVSAEAAIDLLRKKDLSKDIKVLAYYYGPGVHRGIRRGFIAAAPTDKQGLQARLALDIVVRVLDGEPYLKHVGPKVEIIDRAKMQTFDETSSIPPRGFRPVFSVKDWN
ncbi:MAG: TMAO reductase system periplasmic protein TorT, partial [Rhodospirillaceae bacterium]